VIGCYAGLEAERLFDPGAPEHHGSGDRAVAFEQSFVWEVYPRRLGRVGDEAHHAYLRGLRAEACRLVRRHRRAIEALAEELLSLGQMDGERAEAFLDGRLGVGWRTAP
jgi:hypothetical protein